MTIYGILYFLRHLMWRCELDGKCRFFVAGNSQPLRDGEIAEQILKWKGWDGNRQKEYKGYWKDGMGTYKKNTKAYILKPKKFADSAFQSQKIWKKCVNRKDKISKVCQIDTVNQSKVKKCTIWKQMSKDLKPNRC